MNADESKSATRSARTSPGVLSSEEPRKESGENGRPKSSDDGDLAREAELAKEAVLQTLDRLKADLLQAADVEYWTRQHPWAAVGVAAAAGFVAAAALAPERREKSRQGACVCGANGSPSVQSVEPARGNAGPSWLSSLLTPLVGVVQAAAENFVHTAFQAGRDPSEEPAAQHAGREG